MLRFPVIQLFDILEQLKKNQLEKRRNGLINPITKRRIMRKIIRNFKRWKADFFAKLRGIVIL